MIVTGVAEWFPSFHRDSGRGGILKWKQINLTTKRHQNKKESRNKFTYEFLIFSVTFYLGDIITWLFNALKMYYTFTSQMKNFARFYFLVSHSIVPPFTR